MKNIFYLFYLFLLFLCNIFYSLSYDYLTNSNLEFNLSQMKIDLWMDRILLSVLRHQPYYAPEIFSALANSLTGDEFAKFLSGEADLKMRLKVILTMPVKPFIIALFRPEGKA